MIQPVSGCQGQQRIGELDDAGINHLILGTRDQNMRHDVAQHFPPVHVLGGMPLEILKRLINPGNRH